MIAPTRRPFLPTVFLALMVSHGLCLRPVQISVTPLGYLQPIRGGGDAQENEERNPLKKVLRIQSPDGTIRRIQVDERVESFTIAELLESLGVPHRTTTTSSVITMDQEIITSAQQPLNEISWKHGSLLSIRDLKNRETSALANSNKDKKSRFDPFPDLAKDYHRAVRLANRQRHRSGGLSYAALADLQSSMHTVEPQPSGPVERFYMSATAATQFQQEQQSCPCGLLLGTFGRERKRPGGVKSRTSLSSSTEQDAYCSIAKVHALWPCRSAEDIAECLNNGSWRSVADQLGLQPVGWIFRYNSTTATSDEDEHPVTAQHIAQACALQIQLMEQREQKQGATPSSSFPGFVTAAMDATTGATEVFQMSDVAVQMVAEGVWTKAKSDDDYDDDKHIVTTRQPILVDGTTTYTLDTVLCLINTALLQHEGLYSSYTAASWVKPTKDKNRSVRLTTTGRRKLVQALRKHDTSSAVFPLLSHFPVLVALGNAVVSADDHAEVCRLVRKWAQGQKQSIQLKSELAERLIKGLQQ